MKKLLAIALFLCTLSAYSQTTPVTPSFRINTPVNSKDTIAYTYPGKVGGYSWLYNAEYIRTFFAPKTGGSYVPFTRQIINGWGLQGGQQLNVDVTKSIDTPTLSGAYARLDKNLYDVPNKTAARANLKVSYTPNTTILNLSHISGWGTSITLAGNGGSNSWGNRLNIATGRYFYNFGVSGDTYSQILTRFLAGSARWGDITTIEVGQNDATTDSVGILGAIKRMTDSLEAHGNRRYLVLSILTSGTEIIGNANYNNKVAINNILSARYGIRYWDHRGYLISRYNPALPQDVIDFANNTVPLSERSDNLHLNTLGNYNTAIGIAPALDAVILADTTVIIPQNIPNMFASPFGLGTTTPNIVVGTSGRFIDSLNSDTYVKTPIVQGSKLASGRLILRGTNSTASPGFIKFGSDTLSVFDDANNRWGLNTRNPATTLHLKALTAGTGIFRMQDSLTTGSAQIAEWAWDNAGRYRLRLRDAAATNLGFPFTADYTGSNVLIQSNFIFIPNGGIQTAQTSTESNLWIPNNAGVGSTTSSTWQMPGATTTFFRYGFGGNVAATLTTGSGYTSAYFKGRSITKFSSGTHPMLANVTIDGNTSTGSATATETASLFVTGAGTGGTTNYGAKIIGGTRSDSLTTNKIYAGGTFGTANQLLRVNSAATAAEWFTPTFGSGTVTSITPGYGFTSSTPITTTGTMTIDTATAMASKAYVGNFASKAYGAATYGLLSANNIFTGQNRSVLGLLAGPVSGADHTFLSGSSLSFVQDPSALSGTLQPTTITGVNKTWTLPDASGTVALTATTPIITSGTSAPASTPSKVGDIYVDTSARKLYFSVGSSSSADWEIAN